jgi:hypothetical protein
MLVFIGIGVVLFQIVDGTSIAPARCAPAASRGGMGQGAAAPAQTSCYVLAAGASHTRGVRRKASGRQGGGIGSGLNVHRTSSPGGDGYWISLKFIGLAPLKRGLFVHAGLPVEVARILRAHRGTRIAVHRIRREPWDVPSLLSRWTTLHPSGPAAPWPCSIFLGFVHGSGPIARRWKGVRFWWSRISTALQPRPDGLRAWRSCW